MPDQKITELDELTTPASADLLAIVDDVVGSPATKKIEVGNVVSYGKNLIQNAAFIDSDGDDLPDFWDLTLTPTLAIVADTLFPSRGGNQITITSTGASFEGIKHTGGIANPLKVSPSTVYTFSVDYKATAGDNFLLYIRSYNGASGGTIHINAEEFTSTTATRISRTFTTDANADNLEVILYTKFSGDVAICSHPKLEEGAIATPYVDETSLNHIQIVDLYHPFARAYPATDQDDITDNTWTQVVLGTEDYDIGSNFASNQFTVPVTGLYCVNGNLTWEAAAIVANKNYGVAVYVDPLGVGSDAEVMTQVAAVGPQNEEASFHVSDMLKLNKGDEVTLWAFHHDGTGNPDIKSGSAHTSLSVNLMHLAV